MSSGRVREGNGRGEKQTHVSEDRRVPGAPGDKVESVVVAVRSVTEAGVGGGEVGGKAARVEQSSPNRGGDAEGGEVELLEESHVVDGSGRVGH